MNRIKPIHAALLGIALLYTSINAAADTIDFRDNGNIRTAALTEGIVTVTGSGLVRTSIQGLGIDGVGTSALDLEPGETMTFSFATPVADVTLIDILPTDIGNDGAALNATLESFDASGTSTATVVTPLNLFSAIEVSQILGVAGMSSFSITMNNDAIRVGGISFSTAQAMLIVDSTNRLVGIQELQVGTDRFDVTFAAGQYDDTFTANGVTPIFIGNESAANAAAFAIFDAINDDGRFVDLPQNIGGCSNLDFLECGIMVPFNGPYATGLPSTPFAVDVWTAFYDGNPFGGDGVFSQEVATSGLGIAETFTWAVFTPSSGGSVEELLADLVATVVTLNINAGISNALDSKVQNAIDALDRAQTGDSPAAIGILYAFIQSVDAQRDKSISTSDADELVAKATAIIDRLEES